MGISKAEAGRLGGKATATKHGRAYMQQLGHAGGRATVERHGSQHMSEIGARGFAAYCQRHHGGIAEHALFALAKAGRLALSWRQPEGALGGFCGACDLPTDDPFCPACHRIPIPF